MRATILVMLLGFLLVSACVPAGEAPSATDTPIPAATEPPADAGEPAATETPTPTEEPEPPAAFDGEAMLQDRCTQCHSLSRITGASKSAEGWRSAVERMVNYGAVLNVEELEALVQYLAETYP
jgi:cytochrome c5